jgi:pyridoxamine 5'-phosphate oxidase
VSLGGERRDYEGLHLDRSELAPDPIEQFRDWLAAARDAGIYEPEAMTVSTVGPDGRPTARYVLLRGLDERGCFYTNYESAKGRALARTLRR